MSEEKLTLYRVTLHEEKGDKHFLVFDCYADDADHADDQASIMYPNAEILHTIKMD